MPTIALNGINIFVLCLLNLKIRCGSGFFFRIKGIYVVKIIAGISGIDKTSNARRTGTGAVLPENPKVSALTAYPCPKTGKKTRITTGSCSGCE